jgi:hypothetical protein
MRFIAAATFEHRFVNAAFEYLDTKDQPSIAPAIADVNGRGYSVWVTPKSHRGIEGLVRFDHLTPNRAFDRRPATAPSSVSPTGSRIRATSPRL